MEMSKKDKTMEGNVMKNADSAIKEAEILQAKQNEPAQEETAAMVDPQKVKYAYSMIENHGKYHVVSVEFDPNALVAGKVTKIESNTDKFLMQERLQVLLMASDLF